ncbi:MAG TPA: cytochrome c maturation protein CcmE [Acidimicrobiia bacterium]|nr:cytochrome c maturation protein CcmE [Acidimicrobiia bacterium]
MTVDVMDPPVPVVARRKPRRMRYIVAGGLCAAAVLFLIVGGLSRNIVYFRTVSEAVRNKQSEGTHRFRLMGAVVTGSRQRTPDGVTFWVTDGTDKVQVTHHGDPPELFKDGIPVVCEGHWQGDAFDSDRIMIKHGADYHPPQVDASQ